MTISIIACFLKMKKRIFGTNISSLYEDTQTTCMYNLVFKDKIMQRIVILFFAANSDHTITVKRNEPYSFYCVCDNTGLK